MEGTEEVVRLLIYARIILRMCVGAKKLDLADAEAYRIFQYAADRRAHALVGYKNDQVLGQGD
jgi:hypothetical protein